MFYFYADKNKDSYKGMKGVPLRTKRLFADLPSALAKSPARVLVVDTDALPSTPTGTKLGEVSLYEAREKKNKKEVFVPRDAIRNLSPYQKPMEIAAGGGIITRVKKDELHILLIHRKGVWDLPKGKQDPGESISQCAKREVKEELGISRVKIVKALDVSVHVYSENRRFKVKTTHWFQMKTKDTTFTPEKREGIKEVKWFSFNKAERIVGYKNLRKLLLRTRPLMESDAG
ncbi:MAG: hypothetical protein BMS9Abin05_2467 [Rhodothermia bacterium]|nr:MAG: hypothetical protein BMS9Abin05_2467 [Rhodothermia bacterium]